MASTFSKKEIERARTLKEAQIYKNEGYRQAEFLTRSWPDYENHFFAAAVDLNFCLLPVYLWGVEFILILAGVIPPMVFDLLFYLMYGLLFITSCVILPIYTAAHHGVTPGYKTVGFRLVNKNKKPAGPMQLVLRQLVGTGLPIMIFGYFFSVFGLVAWWLLDMLVCLISPNQESIADWIFGTRLVITRNIHIKVKEKDEIQEEKKEEPQPEIIETKKQPEPEKAEGKVMPIDLHIRSNYSDDGYYDVEEIFQQAKANKMEVISITDHNNARANAQAVRFASMYGVKYIPGMEIDCMCNGQRLRLLAYYMDWTAPVFAEIERLSLKREKDCSIARTRAFEKAMHVHINVEELLKKSRFQTISGRQLTEMLFKHRQGTEHPVVKDYLAKNGQDLDKAMKAFEKDYFSKGGVCDVEGTYPDAVAMIKAIHEAGGLSVLSCWHLEKLRDATVEILLQAGLDGVELFSPDMDEETFILFLMLAKQEKLLITAGSDYHGPTKPGRKMGVTGMTETGEKNVRVFCKGALQSDENRAQIG